MGIKCQINLSKLSDGIYSASGTVSGIIQYTVDEVTVFDKITVSLKGHGTLIVHDQRDNASYDNYSFTRRETYIDEDIVTKNEKKTPHEIGTHEKKFHFKLPDKLPSSLCYYGTNTRFRVRCNIIYYVRIKFEKPGFLQFAKRFKRELTVKSQIKPTLLTQPVIYGEQKKIFQLIPSKNSIVNIKANIKKSVVSPGGTIDLEYDVRNDTTNVTVKGVETKLTEIYTFTTSCGREIKIHRAVDSTETKTGSIKSEEEKHFDLNINVPIDKFSLGHSNIVTRNYLVQIIAELPFPHTNVVLEIPVEICDVIQETEVGIDTVQEIGLNANQASQGPSSHNPPPSYWAAMGEELKTEDLNSDTIV
ncbi:uncharacterized protein LOC128680676 [Plodia interpunctella]|uniref:uncharacterized protein LOC128680676 n=1 Tax=Plodia interpunctella TaxID=58824 RepID=UPI002368E775|nr:uncharacterized protein LOC128680676 [Plodia interpunctella]